MPSREEFIERHGEPDDRRFSDPLPFVFPPSVREVTGSPDPPFEAVVPSEELIDENEEEE